MVSQTYLSALLEQNKKTGTQLTITISHLIRTRESLGIINTNMMQQHTQMRQELQDRHQDITNDVNQCKCLVFLHI